MANVRNALRTLVKHPGFFFMRAFARFDGLRSGIVAAQRTFGPSVRGFIATQRGRKSDFFDGCDVERLVSQVEGAGVSFGLNLRPSEVQELNAWAMANPCWVDRKPELGFMPRDIERVRAALGRRFLIAQYFNARQKLPLLQRLSEDPVILEIAARYLGAPPKLVGTNLWWSYPGEADAAAKDYAAQMFHYDLDDFRFVKFFFYLTDVDATAGPHVAVLGSHRHKHRKSFLDHLVVRRYSDEEIEQDYGADKIVTITGKAGTGFVEDTICIHKGTTPTAKDRLVLQFQYALNDFGNQHDDIDERSLSMLDP